MNHALQTLTWPARTNFGNLSRLENEYGEIECGVTAKDIGKRSTFPRYEWRKFVFALYDIQGNVYVPQIFHGFAMYNVYQVLRDVYI